jgi:hypothetical protein
MKVSLCILFLFKNLVVLGQLSDLNTNVTKQDSSRMLPLENLNEKYDFILGYSEESYWWSNSQVYKILVCKNDTWEAFQIVIKKNKGGKTKSETLKYCFDPDSAKQLIANLTKLDFWTFDRDSLNQKTIQMNDSTDRTLHIDDGVNYRFEVMSYKSHRIIESYEPEIYYKSFPEMNIRKAFIECKQLFLQAWKNNRS